MWIPLFTAWPFSAQLRVTPDLRRNGRLFSETQHLVSLTWGTSFHADLSKALVLTEIGPRRDPATLKLFLSNMERLLRTGAHGYMHASTQGPGWG